MDSRNDKAIEADLEQLIEHGPEGIASVFARTFEMAMRIERERFLGAGHYERTTERRSYANGYKSKRIDTPAGTVDVAVPKTAGHGALKAVTSGALIAAASTLAKRYPGFGALIASLPLVSVLGVMWLWNERPDADNMATHTLATFWYVNPSLPMFLLIPTLLRHGVQLLVRPHRRVRADERSLHHPDLAWAAFRTTALKRQADA